VVEIPDDDSPPPGWDQWVSFPTLSPESQEGAIVRRREGHMVAGGRGHSAEASSSRTGRSAPVEGLVGDPPAFADAQGGQELWGELRNHGAALDWALNKALNEALDALRTPDGWLSYRAMALRDQLHESARQDPACPSTLEQARADLERMRTLAANWETEVAGVRNDNLELHSLLRGAQAQQG
jgi:hypothetical protein